MEILINPNAITMIGDFTAYYLDEQEFKKAVELNKILSIQGN